MFLDTVSELANRSEETAKQLLTDLRSHAQNSGTAVGKQINSAVSDAAGELTRMGETHITNTLNAALSSGAHLAQAASGVLANLADSLSSAKGDKKKDSGEG